MPNIVLLSGGNHAELRDPRDVSERLRRPVQRAMALVSPAGQAALDASQRLAKAAREGETPLSEEEQAALRARVQFSGADIDALNEANDLAVVALVKHWTLSAPVSLESVLDLVGRDYDALRTAVSPLVSELFVDFGASTDSSSPTAPSSDSATRSGEAVETVSLQSGGPTGSSNSASA